MIRSSLGLGTDATEQQQNIIEYWIKEKDKFKDTETLKNVLTETSTNWAMQQYLYRIKTPIGEDKNIQYLRLYSTRTGDDVRKLKAWATQVNIPFTTTDKYDQYEKEAGKAQDYSAPFKGHLGDKATALWYYYQKTHGEGKVAFLLEFTLTAKASKQMVSKIIKERESGVLKDKLAKEEQTKIGEGFREGEWGFKPEEGTFSLALGESSNTWDQIKGDIQKIAIIQ